MNISYLYVPAGALLCYVFLLFCFMGRTNDKLISSFKKVLLSCTAWTFGSLCLRLQLYPGIAFWFHFSFLGLLAIPASIYDFLKRAAGSRYRSGFSRFYWCLTLLLGAVNVTSSFFVAPPEARITGAEKIVYRYHFEWPVLLLALIEILVVTHIIGEVWRFCRRTKGMLQDCGPLLLGVGLLLTGNLVTLAPGNTFPWDVLAGILNALCFVWFLYRRNLFLLTQRAASGLIFTAAAILGIEPIWTGAKFITAVGEELGLFESPVQLTMWAVMMAFWMMLVFMAARMLLDYFDEKRNREELQCLRKYQDAVSCTLESERILDLLVEVLQKLLHVEGILILTKERDDGGLYERRRTSGLEQVTVVSLPEALENRLLQGPPVLEKQDLIHFTEQLPQDRLAWLKENQIAAAGLLKYDGRLQGMILAAAPKGKKLPANRRQLLETCCVYTSIALRNAQLYRKTYETAITDDTTGLYNRRYALEQLQGLLQAGGRKVLLAFNLDDFKLYNELYGNRDSDECLRWFGGMLREEAVGARLVFRYGSDEFRVLCEDMPLEEASALAERIRLRVMNAGRTEDRRLHQMTVSCGISVFPDTAKDMEELLTQAERACLVSKRQGKNRSTVYSPELAGERGSGDYENSFDKVAPTIYALTAAIDAKDTYTFKHSNRVSEYAVALAKEIGLSGEQMEIIREAGLLHDIGKISIADSILMKKGKLTEEEYRVMKTHVESSVAIIRYLPDMNYVIPAVAGHHERYDGKGYPRGLSARDIPVEARCLAVADCFEAIIARRPYKEPKTVDFALEELRQNAGSQFDPELAEVFIRMVKEGRIHITVPDAEASEAVPLPAGN